MQESNQKRFVVPAIIALTCFITCFVLGVWQVKRHYWKQALLDRIETSLSSQAIQLPETSDFSNLEYTKVRLFGAIDYNKAMFFGQYYENEWGYKVIAPMTIPNNRIVFLNMGWVKPENREKINALAVKSDNSVNVEGLIKLGGKKNWFAPDNNAQKNFWFWYEIDKMREYAASSALPIVVEVIDHKWPSAEYIIVPSRKPDLWNYHIEYAVVWFSLAMAIAVIFFIYRRH